MTSVSAAPWYENAVLYALDVEAFQDSTGDGVGDFRGLIERLDYINRLGVSAIWLLPFYPTPNRDNGYDVKDYYGVDPRLGDLGDFVEFVDAADARGIKVIIDLVVNHTSDQHPWFQEARKKPDSPYRDYYIWVDEEPPPDPERGSVFPGEVEDARVWSYDSEAGAYYYHRFYPFQPDLNTANPAVREEIYKIMNYWLQLGVDGFRVDAATLMIQPKHPDAEEHDDPHELLRSLKRHAVSKKGDTVLLAEADDEPGDLQTYAGEDGMNLLMNFVLNAHLVAAIATKRCDPLTEAFEQLPDLEHGTWANFLRNYDELNLGRLPDDLREEVFDIFAPDPDMRIYGRGIRRRLAPMVDGDVVRLKLAYSLLFSMPGTPMVLYGDEIGMGEDLSLPGRDAVRTPMQWSDDRNAGFSNAPAAELVAPVISDEEFGYKQVNVDAQRCDPDSLFNWIQRLTATRRECHAIDSTALSIVETDPEGLFAHRYQHDERGLLCVHNLSDESAAVEFALEENQAVHSVLRSGECVQDITERLEVSLDGFGFAWFQVHTESLDQRCPASPLVR